MTVAELIVKLQEMPQDARVIHDLYSDFADLPEPSLIEAKDKIVCLRKGWHVDSCLGPMRWSDRYKQKDENEVVFITAVHFAGN